MGYCYCKNAYNLNQNIDLAVDNDDRNFDATGLDTRYAFSEKSVIEDSYSRKEKHNKGKVKSFSKFKIKGKKNESTKLTLSIIHTTQDLEHSIIHEINHNPVNSDYKQRNSEDMHSTMIQKKIKELLEIHPIIQKRFSECNIDIKNITSNIFNQSNKITILLLGGPGVGKSSFVIKLTKNYFEKLYIPTLGVEIFTKTFNYQNEVFSISFIVTPGDHGSNEDYSPLFAKANFILLFYDVSVEGSFNNAKKILFNEISNYAWIFKNKITNFYFVGNKKDIIPRKENYDIIQTFCQKHNFEFYEISVKEGVGVKALINNIIEKYIEIIS